VIVGYIDRQFYWYGSVRFQLTKAHLAFSSGWDLDFLEYAEIR